MIKRLYSFICLLMMTAVAAAQRQLAFPSAEGYGKYTVGGRGGKVYEVTNLNDTGEGSLRAAVEAEGPRTVVFRISGTIDLKSPLRIKHPYITIAGQTAPGDGICIKRYPLSIGASEVIIRHIRVRVGDESGRESDGLSASRHLKNIILDHVSVSWSIDETLSIYHCKNVTIQWCMITESLSDSNHSKGMHGFGGIWGSDLSTYHHNLIAHHTSRNPRFTGASGSNDYRNNVIYNWGFNSCYGGENTDKNGNGHTEINMVANYYKAGPATEPGKVQYRIANPSYKIIKLGKWFIDKNYVEGYPEVTADNWNGGVQITDMTKLGDIRLMQPWPAMPIREHTAEEAYRHVLSHAGASLPKRDAIDTRIMKEVEGGYATYEGTRYRQRHRVSATDKPCGIIDSQNDVGGWPLLKSKKAPRDTDHDGMPDKWEKRHGLNPKDAADGAILSANGYTNLEIYLNHLAGE